MILPVTSCQITYTAGNSFLENMSVYMEVFEPLWRKTRPQFGNMLQATEFFPQPVENKTLPIDSIFRTSVRKTITGIWLTYRNGAVTRPLRMNVKKNHIQSS